MKGLLRAASAILASVALMAATGGTWPFVGHGSGSYIQTMTVPQIIPVAYDGMSPAPDAGPNADAYLFQQERLNRDNVVEPAGAPCPGPGVTPSGCTVYKYVDVVKLSCNTVESQAAYNFGLTHESAFAHAFNHPISSAYRYAVSGSPNCDGTHRFWMNVGDPTYDAWLTSSVWENNTSTGFPNLLSAVPVPQVMIWEDTLPMSADTAVGGSPPFTEYGSSGTTGIATLPGTGTYSTGYSWETAIADFVNSAASANLLITLNGLSAATGDLTGCSVISGGSCHDPTYPDVVNDQLDISVLCSHLATNNLPYVFLEHPFIHEGTPPTSPGAIASATTMVTEVNTWAALMTHTSDNCSNTKFVDAEFPVGTAGTVASGYQYRLIATAARSLVADTFTNTPDRIIGSYSPIGGLDVAGEIPYFFEQTFVPVMPEIPVPPFVFNGTTQGIGANCENIGDSGGAVALKVTCGASNAPVLCQQYKHLYINWVDHGNVAFCLNTSTTTENITSSWFARSGSDPISSYNWEYSPSGGEMTCVPFAGVNGGGNCPSGASIDLSAYCTNGTNCTGANSLSTQVVPFKGDGTDQLCGQCGVVLIKND